VRRWELSAAVGVCHGGTFFLGAAAAGGEMRSGKPSPKAHAQRRQEFGMRGRLHVSENKFHLKAKCSFPVRAVRYCPVLPSVPWSTSVPQLAGAGCRGQRVHVVVCACSQQQCLEILYPSVTFIFTSVQPSWCLFFF